MFVLPLMEAYKTSWSPMLLNPRACISTSTCITCIRANPARIPPHSQNCKTNVELEKAALLAGTETPNESLMWALTFNQQEWEESVFSFSTFLHIGSLFWQRCSTFIRAHFSILDNYWPTGLLLILPSPARWELCLLQKIKYLQERVHWLRGWECLQDAMSGLQTLAPKRADDIYKTSLG